MRVFLLLLFFAAKKLILPLGMKTLIFAIDKDRKHFFAFVTSHAPAREIVAPEKDFLYIRFPLASKGIYYPLFSSLY